MCSARHLASGNVTHRPQVGPSGGGSNILWFDLHASYIAWKTLVPILHWDPQSKYWKPLM